IPFAQVLSMPGVKGATWSCSLNVTAAAITITDVNCRSRGRFRRQGAQRVAVDAILSVVFKSQAADVDPQGAVLGARIYSQLALGYRELRTGNRVFALNGTIHLVAANAVPATQAGLDHSIKALANERLVASAFCESNLAGSDSTFAAG